MKNMNSCNNKLFSDLEKHKLYLDLLSRVNNSCIFLIKHPEGTQNSEFIYLSPNFTTFFGYESQEINYPNLDPDFLNKQIHPTDYISFKIFQERLKNYLLRQPRIDLQNFKHIYEFRAIKKGGYIVRVISQHQIIEIDEEGSPKYVLGIIDISPDQSPSESVKFRLINTSTGEIVNIPSLDSEINLSKREKEILKLMDEGLLSKEISNKLFISVHTVNGHRQNILQKMDADNTPEALNYARKLGLI
ncbi:LuxR C-terminal-related transcriptional regulator [Dysgonomonas sp. Marseille-Q5470]|uniref:LuxR C-terminal-related transcriptional regulator n=1 Tax=Dysgonomonas sp. Marseille-Q5470 TaxID=3039494 RepID=UPI0024BCCF51|nr:LuxR C-terminal-related transcriptional regulator [Dysgonomonas sp. Marseille-Q5470]